MELIEKMELKEAIRKRRTIREFQATSIERDILKKIVNDGMQAPSNSHVRKWCFISIEDPDVRGILVGMNGEELIKERDPEKILDDLGFKDKAQRTMYKYSIPIQAKMILTAGAVLIPVYSQPFPLMQPKERMHLNYFASIWMCIENMLLSAVEENIYGVTYIPKFPERIKTLLKIPDKHEFPCVLALGYPQEGAKSFKPDSYNIDQKIHYNYWQE